MYFKLIQQQHKVETFHYQNLSDKPIRGHHLRLPVEEAMYQMRNFGWTPRQKQSVRRPLLQCKDQQLMVPAQH